MGRYYYLLAFVWGGILAAFLQWHPFGKFLALRRTWITVVIGVGVDLLILKSILNRQAWARVIAVISLSSVLIILRSLINELNDNREAMYAIWKRSTR